MKPWPADNCRQSFKTTVLSYGPVSESDSLACTISNTMSHARGLLSEGPLKTTVWRNGTTVTGGTTVTALQTHWPG